MIRLAIAKGRILEKCNAILKKVGIECKYNPITSRKLIIPTNYKNLEVIVIKASDVPVYIDSGKVDLGIAGADTLMEDDKENHYRLHDMKLSQCRLCLLYTSPSPRD